MTAIKIGWKEKLLVTLGSQSVMPSQVPQYRCFINFAEIKVFGRRASTKIEQFIRSAPESSPRNQRQ